MGKPQPYWPTLWSYIEQHKGRSARRERLALLAQEWKGRTGVRRLFGLADTDEGVRRALGEIGPAATEHLEKAVEAYRAAQEQTRERVPLQWAAAQYNLGTGLQMLGEQESGTKRLEEAAESFSNVLQVDPDNERAYDKLNFLYHNKLFAFAEAFDLHKPGWSGTPMTSEPRKTSPRRRSPSAGSPKPSNGWRHLWTGRS
jgi:tetratricopeptide (TPR) repeat protein